MIYTSYFAKLDKLPKEIVPISICGKSPEGYKGIEYKKLAPLYSFFSVWKRNHDNDYYIAHYVNEVLLKLEPKEVVKELYEIAGNPKDICLVCYEKT